MSDPQQWTKVDAYLADRFAPPDPVLDAALRSTAEAGMPSINVSPNQGKLLYVLARAHAVRSILEIGTLGGYSTIWLARALPPSGRLITLEIDAKHVAVARTNIERAGLSSIIDIRLGAALETLDQLIHDGAASFDMVFIDADKASTPHYLDRALQLTHIGSLILIDNVIRDGAVSDPHTTDANVQGIQQAFDALAVHPHVVTSVLQTVGSKGYDGLAIALVTA